MRVGWAILLASTLLASTAQAQPSVWERAKRPAEQKAYFVLLAVERKLQQASASTDPFMRERFARAAVAMMELSGAAELPDPRLRFLLGDLLLSPSVDRPEEAKRVLERALAEWPDSPLAAEGWFNLAIAHAKLGHSGGEYEAYTKALELIWEPDHRANIYLNRAESSMVLGHTDAAIRDYRRAIRLASDPRTQALAYYGLGIVLERSGDLPSSLDAIERAVSMSVTPVGSALDAPGVFFVPSFDIHYYKALEAMALARRAKRPEVKRHVLARAAAQWAAYLAEAEPAGHRWVPNARLHLENVERQLEELDQAAAPPRRR